MTKFNRVFAAAVLLAGVPLGALAQVTQNVQVSVQVNGNCTVTAPSNATFAPQAPLVPTTVLAEGQVTLRCNAGAAPVLAVNDGGNFSGTRRMINGTNFVAYLVKQPTLAAGNYTACPLAGAGTAWTSVSTLNASPAFASSGGNRTVRVCFETTVDENTPLALYTDTVAVSVTF